MKMQRFVIFLLVGLMFLPTAFMNAAARPTVINVNYSAQAWSAGGLTDEDVTIHIHGFGFPGEELDWEGTFVIPASQGTQPSWVSSIVMIEAEYTSTSIWGRFALSDSTNPDINGCMFDFAANVNGHMYLDHPYQPYCPDIRIDASWGATVVINM
jgi:hypothetical protein